MEEELDQLFKKNTRSSRNGCSIRCRQGLWAVSAPDPATALQEARHYFVQYLGDGEYGNQ